MKVPFFNGRIDRDFKTYLAEFELGATTSITAARARVDGKRLFAAAYPLFTLLQGLLNADYYRDPSREIVAAEFQAKGLKSEFIRVRRQKSKGQDEVALREGLRRIAFGSHFQELFSDALLLLNSFYTNNYRGAGISLRCMLEDLYRSLYYRDHPEELNLLADEDVDEITLGLRPAALRDYLRRVSYLKRFQGLTTEFAKKVSDKDADMFGVNEDLYSRCSSFVHGTKAGAMAGLQSNGEMIFDNERAEVVTRATQQVVRLSIAFLIPAYLDHFIAFNEYEKSIVLTAFDDATRGNFRAVLNV